MNPREANLLWLKDLLEHLSVNRQQLEWAEDNETRQLVTEAMLRDLDRCTQLVRTLNRRASVARTS